MDICVFEDVVSSDEHSRGVIGGNSNNKKMRDRLLSRKDVHIYISKACLPEDNTIYSSRPSQSVIGKKK